MSTMRSQGLAIATVSTRSHLHAALVLVESIRATWKSPVPIYVALIEGDEGALGEPFAAAGAVALDASSVGAPDFPWLVTKYNAFEISCCIKPFVVSALLDRGHDAVLYVDGDVLFLADGEPMVRYQPDAPFVVVPHMLSPFTHDPHRLKPSLNEIATAGMMNAGLFVARDCDATRGFLTAWGDLTTRPGACVAELSGVVDQQSFNWVTSFVDGVAVLRDPCVNVAYWNLHERPIRSVGLDGGDPELWTLDGQPLSSFHFSGFRPGSGSLSLYDGRGAATDPHVIALCDLYADRLTRALRMLGPQPAYSYGKVDDVVLVDALRDGMRRMEVASGVPAWVGDAWPEVARASLAAVHAALASAPLIPAYVARLLAPRSDLAELYEPGALFADGLLDWLATASLAREYDEGRFYERHTKFAIAIADVNALARAAADSCDSLDVGTATKLLLADRPCLLELIEDSEVAAAIAAGRYRIPAHEAATCLRRIYSMRQDVRDEFPDPLGANLNEFGKWLAHWLPIEYELPDDVAALAANLDLLGALARILGRLQRHPPLRERVRAEGLVVDVIRAMRPEATGQHGFSLTDLVLAEWWTHGRTAAERRTVTEEVFRPIPAVPNRAEPVARDPEGINVFGQFKSPNGLGSLSHGLSRAIESGGYHCSRVLLTNATMDSDLSLDDLRARGNESYARDMAVCFPHIDFDLHDAFPDALGKERESIAYLAWEQRNCNRLWAKRFERFDRLFAISSFAADSIADGFGRPCMVLPAVVEIGEVGAEAGAALRAQLGIAADAFVVGAVFDAGSGIERKNPLATVSAVARAFTGRSDVVFVMKAGNSEWPEHARRMRETIRVLDDAGIAYRLLTHKVDRSRIDALMSSFDLFLSLHRAEGFGYTMAEAMLHRVPVVGTAYSGNLDFMNAENSYPVAYREVAITRPEGPFALGTMWAEADVDDAAEKCRHVYDNRGLAAARAARGHDDVARLCSAAAVGRHLRALLS